MPSGEELRRNLNKTFSNTTLSYNQKKAALNNFKKWKIFSPTLGKYTSNKESELGLQQKINGILKTLQNNRNRQAAFDKNVLSFASNPNVASKVTKYFNNKRKSPPKETRTNLDKFVNKIISNNETYGLNIEEIAKYSKQLGYNINNIKNNNSNQKKYNSLKKFYPTILTKNIKYDPSKINRIKKELQEAISKELQDLKEKLPTSLPKPQGVAKNNKRAKVNEILKGDGNKNSALKALLKSINNVNNYKELNNYIKSKVPPQAPQKSNTTPPLPLRPGTARLFKNGKATGAVLTFQRQGRKYLVMSPPGTANRMQLKSFNNGSLRFMLN